MICATVSETGLPLEDCLVGCIIATNTMGQVHGFTPEQIAFGKNRTNVVTFAPPSLVDYTTIPMDHQNAMTSRLTAMQVARDVHHKCSVKESLYRAMRLNVRTVDFVGNIGDKVWFWKDPKFKGDQTWRGPGVICGKDDLLYMVRMGGGVSSRHPHHLLHYSKGLEDLKDNPDPDPLGVGETDSDSEAEELEQSQPVALDEDEVDVEYLDGEDEVAIPDSYKAIFDELWDGPREGPEWDAHVREVMLKVHDVHEVHGIHPEEVYVLENILLARHVKKKKKKGGGK